MSSAGRAFGALCAVMGAAAATPRHRVETRQVVFADPGRHHYKTLCAKLMCTSDKSGPAPATMSLIDWEGSSSYDLPYSFAYVIDVAVKGSTDTDYGEYSTIVDTGSSNLGIAEESCSACGGSSTSTLDVSYDSDVCIEVVYGDSKADSTYWTGYQSASVEAGFVSDSGSVTTSTTFAAITDASSDDSAFFTGGYAGILGLAYPGIAESYYNCDTEATTSDSTPLLDALNAAGLLKNNLFTLSFCGLSAPMVLGEVDMDDLSGVPEYTDAQKTMGEYYGYYLVKVESFEVGGEDLGVDVSGFNTYGGMLVDSGTTELILPTDVYVSFAAYLMDSVDWLDQGFFEYESCLTEDALSELPSMSFGLSNDITIELPANNYLIYYEGCYYWGAAASTMSIMGNVALQGLTVIFDRDTNVIGFGTASCSDSTSGVSVDATTPSSSDSVASTKRTLRKTKKGRKDAIRGKTQKTHVHQLNGPVKHLASTAHGKTASDHTAADAPITTKGEPSNSRRVVRAGVVSKPATSKSSASPTVIKSKRPSRLIDRYPRLTPQATMQLHAKISGSASTRSRGAGARGQASSFMQAAAILGGLLCVGIALIVVRSLRQKYERREYQLVGSFEM